MNAARGVFIALLGAAALAVVALPRQRPEYRRTSDPLALRYASAAARLGAQVEHWRIADSRAVARQAAQIAPVRREVVEFAVPPAGASGFASNMRVLAMREVERMPRHDTSVRVVVAFTIDTGAITRFGNAASIGSSWSVDAFVPVRDSASTCTVVARVHHQAWVRPLDSARMSQTGGAVLGPCAWYGAYGLPGRGIAAWLDSTEHGALENAWRGLAWPSRIRRYSGEFHSLNWGVQSDAVLACIAKREQACEQIVMRPTQLPGWRQIDVAHPDGMDWGRQYYDRMSAMSGWVLSALEREIGPDGFATFWKSDLPLPDAFAAARGESLTNWLSAKLTDMFAPYRPGPLPPARTSLALFVALPGFIALGLYAVRQRATFG